LREKAVSALGMTKGARDIDSTPPAIIRSASPADGARGDETASMPEPHRRLMVEPGTLRAAGEQQRHAGDVAVVLAGLVGAAEDDVVDRGESTPGLRSASAPSAARRRDRRGDLQRARRRSGRSGCGCSRRYRAVLLIIGMATPAAGGGSACEATAAPDVRMSGCTALIQSGRLDGRGLAEAYITRGDAFAEASDHARALADYDAAVRFAGEPTETDTSETTARRDLANAYYKRGSFHVWRRADFGRGIADLDKAIAIDPDLTDAYKARGWAYQASGDYDRANVDYEEAIRRFVDDCPLYDDDPQRRRPRDEDAEGAARDGERLAQRLLGERAEHQRENQWRRARSREAS
jgi:hypothetical protein